MKKAEIATKNEVQTIVNNAVSEISEVINLFAKQVDERFSTVESSLDKLEISYNRLLNTLDSFLKRLDDTETEQIARDAQFQKLLAWAKKVSKETGIPLEGF